MQYWFDDYMLDSELRELHRGPDAVQAEPQVFELLLYLIRNRNRVVSKDNLLDVVWQGRIVSESTLFNRINSARSAIGDNGHEQRLIKTIPRKGVRFVGDVREVTSASRSANALEDTSATNLSRDTAWPSIAVLPFTNLNGDQSQDYFSDGITGDIITELSRFSELIVISRNSSFTYKGKSIDIRVVGKQLGVRYVLEGSIARAGDRVRISAQLIDAETGAHRWADRFDRQLEDLFAVQDEVARTIVATIAVRLSKAEVQRALTRPPATWQAHEYYLQAANSYAAYMSSYVVAVLYQARHSLEQALSLDPGMARAHGMLSRTYLSAWINPLDDDYLTAATLERSYQSAQRAVQLDPNLPQARAALGYVLTYKRRHDEALAEFDKAFALNPSFTDWTFILGLVYAGEPSRAIEVGHSLARFDPFSPPVAHGFIGFARYMLKQYETALAPLRDCVRRAPNFRGGHFWLAATLARLGRFAEANLEATEVLRIEPTYTVEGSARAVAAFRDELDTEHWVDGLRQAGLPN